MSYVYYKCTKGVSHLLDLIAFFFFVSLIFCISSTNFQSTNAIAVAAKGTI